MEYKAAGAAEKPSTTAWEEEVQKSKFALLNDNWWAIEEDESTKSVKYLLVI